MKILIICKALPFAYKGGIQTHVWELSKALISLGCKVTILTAGNRTHDTFKKGPHLPEVVSVKYIPGRFVPGFKHIIQDLSFNIQVLRWVNKNQKQFDIIHAQGRSGFLLPLIKIVTPLICTIHRLFPIEVYWGNHHYSTILDKLLHGYFSKAFENRMVKNCNKLIAVSQKTLDEIEEEYGRNATIKTKVISNGAKLKEYHTETALKRNQIIFVGRLSKVKGLSKLLTAMNLIDSSIRLVIVGSGPAEFDIKRSIKNLKLESRVELLGEQPSDKVYQLISESMSLVLPSFHESQGIVLLEANAVKTPVIASNSSGMKEIIYHGYNGLLFEPNNVVDLAAKVNMLAKNPKRSQLMGVAGQYTVEKKYCWKKIAQQTINLYRECA